MSIQGMVIKEEMRVKCQRCHEVFFALSEYEECECGGEAFNIKLSETVYELPYELELGLV